jgi:hypothetical protein
MAVVVRRHVRLTIVLLSRRALVAAALSCCLAGQIFAASLLEEPAAGCCCSETHVLCHCRVCTRARFIEANCDQVESCGPKATPDLNVSIDSFAPPAAAPLQNKARQPLPLFLPHELDSPLLEVPTPPPLRQA